MLSLGFFTQLEEIVGTANCFRDDDSLNLYSADKSKNKGSGDVVVRPRTVTEVASVARLCNESRVPLTVRGAGTGYTGGAVPIQGGVVMSMEGFSRVIEIDEMNLLAIVEPNVITGDLQRAVEGVGLFYPPDPASLNQSVIGGNVAECAGGPRAFKYGTTKNYVLGLEAVLPTGEVVKTGGKTIKNVVGYDLTKLIVGSEGTLAIITKVILRLIPKPRSRETLRATFTSIDSAVKAVVGLIQERIIPAAMELIDQRSLDAVAQHLEDRTLAPDGTGALLLIEVDGTEGTVEEEAALVESSCVKAGATEVLRSTNDDERNELWRVRRELSPSLRKIADLKINHDVVVPRSGITSLFEFIQQLRERFNLTIACFGHIGDGNIHVNIMVDSTDAEAVSRSHQAELALFTEIVRLEGSISGEHGIGLSKASFLSMELSHETISLMKRLKEAFDPHGILNPGKIFPEDQ